MQQWYMVTLVGEDRIGIVASVSRALFENGCNLGEASMVRLGGNFSIMMMVSSTEGVTGLEKILRPVAHDLSLHLHIDTMHAHLHDRREPDVRVRVFGADRTGIVAEVTGVLAECGLHILDLNSEVAGTGDEPVYIMVLDGYAERGVEAIDAALAQVRDSGIEVSVTPVDTMVG